MDVHLGKAIVLPALRLEPVDPAATCDVCACTGTHAYIATWYRLPARADVLTAVKRYCRSCWVPAHERFVAETVSNTLDDMGWAPAGSRYVGDQIDTHWTLGPGTLFRTVRALWASHRRRNDYGDPRGPGWRQ